ncbi:MAG: hypothetical protein PVH89_08010 [Gammaproteobacteria bacterium]
MLSETEQQRFDEVCQEHIWAAVGMYVLNQASGSEEDAEAAAVSVRDLVDIAPAYRSCWDRVKPIVQTQGFRTFIAIVEHRIAIAETSRASASRGDPDGAETPVRGPLTVHKDGELIADQVLSMDASEVRDDSGATTRSSKTRASHRPARSVTAAAEPKQTVMPQARLRVLEGEFSGRELELNKVLTQFGQGGKHFAAILRQHDGYSIVTRDGIRPDEAPLINGARVGRKARNLRGDDIVEIAGIKARFILN